MQIGETRETAVTQKLPIRAAVVGSPDYPFTRRSAAVKLDQNEAAEDFPSHLKTLVMSRLLEQHWNRYPDLNSDALRATIGAYEDWSASGVVVTTGSNVLIGLLTQLAGIGKRVVTVAPNFPLYASGANLLEVALTEVPLRQDLSLDTEAVIAAMQSDEGVLAGGVVYLSQPHAPTGSFAPQDALRSILQQASDKWLVVIDEAYYQFAPVDAKLLAKEYPHVVLLRTFSKAWGLAGLRLGYVLTSDAIASQLQKLVPPFAISVMQTVTAQVALENAGYVKERIQKVIVERERMFQILTTLPTWRVFPSEANFLLIKTPDAARAHEQLLNYGILVRRQDSMPGLQGCIRVTVGSRAENDAFLRAAQLIASSD